MSWTGPRTWTANETVTAAQMNAQLRDNLNFLYRLAVRKATDESVTSSAVLQDDDELKFAIAASETWTFRSSLLYDGATGGDIQVALTCPSGGTIRYAGVGFASSVAVDPAVVVINADNLNGSGTTMFFGALGTGAILLVELTGSVLNSTNAGNVTVQWAQGSSSGTATTVRAGSHLEAFRITA